MSYFACSDEMPEWAAQVPNGWGRNWLKWSVDLSTKRPTEEEQKFLPYIANEDIASWTGKLLIEDLKPTEADSRTFQENDVLFNKLRPYLAKVYHATFDGVSSGELLCLRPSQAVQPRFLFYVLVSKGFIDTVNAETFGAKMPRADWEIVGHQPLPLPPLDTQRRIARFLDEKTARIDGLIEKKRELLDRLAEKRQALITQAVTKGLNPDAPMKPSGIDWLGLGDIPAHSQAIAPAPSDRGGHHQSRRKDRRTPEGVGGMIGCTLPANWTFKRLKYLSTYNDEVLPESTDDEAEIDYVEISGVSLSRGIEEINRMTFAQAPSRARRKVRRGDILISTVRTYLRAIAKVDKTLPDLIASTGFCVVRPNQEVDSGFLGWAAKSEPFVSEVVSRSVGVSYPAINASELVTIEVPLPPLDTQRRIARFLDQKTAQVDATGKQILCSIGSLSEYRSALITAAVTGQLAELR